MKLESSKQAEEHHQKNVAAIARMIKEYESPNTSQTRRIQLRQKFKEIIAHTDKVQQQDSLFFRMAKKVSDNGNGHKGE